ncbi:MAG: diguanylate cyclase [bacterium]|nr:diguanylate cyclase [bacterium]
MRIIVGWMLVFWFIVVGGAAETQPPMGPQASSAMPALVPEGESFNGVEELLATINLRSTVLAIAWSPDGKTLASGSSNGILHLWDLSSGSERLRLQDRSDSIESVAFSPDGQMLAAASNDNIVRVWKLAGTAEPIRLEGGVAVAFSPDGNVIASGSSGGIIHLRNLVDDEFVNDKSRKFKGHSMRISVLAWDVEGRILASGSWDKSIRLWNPRTGRQINRLDGHDDLVNTIAWSADGKLLASGSSDETVRVWDIGRGQEIRCFRGHTGPVYAVTWSAESKLVISGSDDRTIRTWDLSVDQEVGRFEGHGSPVSAVTLSPDGRMLASGSSDATVRVWAFATGEEIRRLEGHVSPVSAIAISPEGGTLAVSTKDNDVRFWRLESDEEIDRSESPGVLSREDYQPLAIAMSPAGNKVAGGFEDGRIRLWESDGIRRSFKILRSFEAHSSYVLAIAFSPDGRLLASGSDDKIIRVWNVDGNTQKLQLNGHEAKILTVAFNPDGTTLASGSDDRTIRLWNLESATTVATFEGQPDAVLNVAFRSENQLFVILRNDTVYLLDLATGVQRQIHRFSNRVSVAALSSDGRYLASSYLTDDRLVRLWTLGLGGEYKAARFLVGGVRGTWIDCEAGGTCWRHDDGRLLVEKDGKGNLKAVAPKVEQNRTDIELSSAPNQLVVNDGAAKSFRLKVRNRGPGRAFWINVRQAPTSADFPLLFHHPTTRVHLDPGKEAELECKISAHTDYENPKGQKLSLLLEINSANGQSISVDPIEVTIHAPSLRWVKARWIRSDSQLLVTLTNVGALTFFATDLSALITGIEDTLSPANMPVSIPPNETVTLPFTLPEDFKPAKNIRFRLIAHDPKRPVHEWIFPNQALKRSPHLFWYLIPLLILGIVAIIFFRYPPKQADQRVEAEEVEELTHLLHACRTTDDACEVITARAHKLFSSEAGALFLLTESNRLRVALVWGDLQLKERQEFERADCWALRRSRLHVVASGNDGPICRHLSEKDISYLCVPLIAEGEQGVLHLKARDRRGLESKVDLAGSVAKQIALGLAHVKRLEQSFFDSLTGLHDLRRWEGELLRRVDGFIRTELPFGVMMVDIDHFGRFNKKYGHLAGNQILRELGKLLQAQFRREDLVCRYGGEEFLIVMPAASAEETRTRAEELRREVKNIRTQHDSQVLEGINLSVGVAAFPDHGAVWPQVLGMADSALNRAKEEGRDRVVLGAPSRPQLS